MAGLLGVSDTVLTALCVPLAVSLGRRARAFRQLRAHQFS